MRWLPVAEHGSLLHYVLPVSALAICLAPRFARYVQAAVRKTRSRGFAMGGPAFGARGATAFLRLIPPLSMHRHC